MSKLKNLRQNSFRRILYSDTKESKNKNENQQQTKTKTCIPQPFLLIEVLLSSLYFKDVLSVHFHIRTQPSISNIY